MVLAALVIVVVVAPPRPAAVDRSDPALGRRIAWNLTAIGAPSAWSHSSGNGVTVAILDSGVDRHHPDLRRRVVGAVDCVGSAGDPTACVAAGDDPDGHGTHVAGIVAADGRAGDGVIGVAPEADLLLVRVLATSCPDRACSATGSAIDVAAGIEWAVQHGAEVVNLSLATTDGAGIEPRLRAAVLDAWRHGVIVVVAAGNDGPGADLTDVPVIVVTGIDRAGRLAAYSYGVGSARWAVAAPGGQSGDRAAACSPTGEPAGVRSTWWSPRTGDRYACLAGTSMAAPHVAGAAAVLLALGLSPNQVIDRLLDTATDLGEPGFDPVYGAGALDLAGAVDPPDPDRVVVDASWPPPRDPSGSPGATDGGRHGGRSGSTTRRQSRPLG